MLQSSGGFKKQWREGKKKNRKENPGRLPNAPPPHLAWGDLELQMAGGWESTLQRQHEVPALLGGTALPGRPRQLAEVGKMVPQPGPEL